jgi:hypothetical protein
LTAIRLSCLVRLRSSACSFFTFCRVGDVADVRSHGQTFILKTVTTRAHQVCGRARPFGHSTNNSRSHQGFRIPKHQGGAALRRLFGLCQAAFLSSSRLA